MRYVEDCIWKSMTPTEPPGNQTVFIGDTCNTRRCQNNTTHEDSCLIDFPSRFNLHTYASCIKSKSVELELHSVIAYGNYFQASPNGRLSSPQIKLAFN